jgi:hypothetical protein
MSLVECFTNQHFENGDTLPNKEISRPSTPIEEKWIRRQSVVSVGTSEVFMDTFNKSAGSSPIPSRRNSGTCNSPKLWRPPSPTDFLKQDEQTPRTLAKRKMILHHDEVDPAHHHHEVADAKTRRVSQYLYEELELSDMA